VSWFSCSDIAAAIQTLALSDSVRIAHVFDLLKAGTLSAWQQTFVQNALVQPFKQVFRECYALTPAEREAHTRSARLRDDASSAA
jgi:hypothetical protein